MRFLLISLCLCGAAATAQEATRKGATTIVSTVTFSTYRKSPLSAGAGLGIGFDQGISESFKIGGRLSRQFFRLKPFDDSYQPFGLKVSVTFYPDKLLSRPNFSLANYYLRTEIGATWDKRYKFDAGNPYILGLGKEFTFGKRKFALDVGASEFSFPDGAGSYNTFRGFQLNLSHLIDLK